MWQQPEVANLPRVFSTPCTCASWLLVLAPLVLHWCKRGGRWQDMLAYLLRMPRVGSCGQSSSPLQQKYSFTTRIQLVIICEQFRVPARRACGSTMRSIFAILEIFGFHLKTNLRSMEWATLRNWLNSWHSEKISYHMNSPTTLFFKLGTKAGK